MDFLRSHNSISRAAEPTHFRVHFVGLILLLFFCFVFCSFVCFILVTDRNVDAVDADRLFRCAIIISPSIRFPTLINQCILQELKMTEYQSFLVCDSARLQHWEKGKDRKECCRESRMVMLMQYLCVTQGQRVFLRGEEINDAV